MSNTKFALFNSAVHVSMRVTRRPCVTMKARRVNAYVVLSACVRTSISKPWWHGASDRRWTVSHHSSLYAASAPAVSPDAAAAAAVAVAAVFCGSTTCARLRFASHNLPTTDRTNRSAVTDKVRYYRGGIYRFVYYYGRSCICMKSHYILPQFFLFFWTLSF